MNRLERFRAKTLSVTLKGDDKPITLMGLTFPELTEFTQLMQRNDTKGAAEFLLFTALRKALPKEGEGLMSDEDLKNEIAIMDGSVASEIINHVSNISGLIPEDKKKVISEGQ